MKPSFQLCEDIEESKKTSGGVIARRILFRLKLWQFLGRFSVGSFFGTNPHSRHSGFPQMLFR